MLLFMRHERCAPRAAAHPTIRAAILAALAAGLVSPAVLSAQDSARVAAPDTGIAVTRSSAADTVAGPTHTVRKGDTLWDLAHVYLSDPFLWPEIYRLNTTIVEDPHWIYPGEVLHVPGNTRLAAADESMPRLQPEQVTNAAGPTVFASAMHLRAVENSRLAETAARFPHTTVRAGEFYAAPWVEDLHAGSGDGVVVASAELPGIAQASERSRIMNRERAYITLPVGAVVSRGDRFMTLTDGPELPGGAHLVIPTGIVAVEQTGNGVASTVHVIRQFGEVKVGQRVIPLERLALTGEAQPAPVSAGMESEVVSVPSGVVLPSIGYYAILSARASDGVKVGDQFTLYKPGREAAIPGGGTNTVVLPEEEIALTQVVRVTDLGTTVLVLSQRHPAISEGVRARLTARMP